MSASIAHINSEHDELADKIKKLTYFVNGSAFDDLDDEHKGLLHLQLKAMKLYLHALDRRLDYLK